MRFRRVLLEGDRGRNLAAQLVALARKLREVLEDIERQTQLTLERNRTLSAEIRVQRRRRDDDRARQRVPLEGSARHDSFEQFKSAGSQPHAAPLNAR